MQTRRYVAASVAAAVAAGWLLGQNRLLPFQTGFQVQDKVISQTPHADSMVFEGVLPCADCSGLKLNLTLRSNHTYVLQSDYVGKSLALIVTEGTWTILHGTPTDPRASVYYLTGSKNEVWYFLKVSDTEIKELDRNRNTINVPLNLSLKRLQ